MSTRNRYNGITSYTLDEADNVSLGQAVFDFLEGKADADGIEHIAGQGALVGDVVYYPDVNYWVSIKAIARATAGDSSIIAETLIGDDLMLRPAIGYYSTGSGDNIDLQEDDVINGCFTRIRICDAVTFVQALRG